MPGRGSTVRIGRLAGVPIGVHPLWLVIVALLTPALGDSYFPTEAPGLSDGVAYLLGLLSAPALFAGILLHELGHAIVARRHGLEVEEIDPLPGPASAWSRWAGCRSRSGAWAGSGWRSWAGSRSSPPEPRRSTARSSAASPVAARRA